MSQLFCLFFLNATFVLSSQYAHTKSFEQTTQAHSTASFVTEHQTLKSGTNWLGLRIQPEPNWHTYWRNPGDSASAPVLTLKGGHDVRLKELHFPKPQRIPFGPLTSFGYENDVLLLLEIEVLPVANSVTSDVELTLDAEWLICKVECVPGVFTFKKIMRIDETIAPSTHFDLFQTFKKQLPGIAPESARLESSNLRTQLSLPSSIHGLAIDVFPYTNALVNNEAPQIRNTEIVFANSDLAATATQTSETFLVVTEESAVVILAQRSSQTLGWMLLFGWLGGLILNLMPCVFPVLTLKAYMLVRQDRKSVIVSNLLYVAGVLTSFVLLAAILAFVRESGQALGWGFQLQSPIFVGFMIGLFILMGVFFLDAIPLSLSSLMNFGQKWNRGNGHFSSYLTGVLAVVVASPCTAPFMGAAMGYALSQSTFSIFAIFLSIGLGLSLPFLALAFFPQLVLHLPPPGPWLDRFKKAMALPMFATAVWLGWVLYLQMGVSNFTLDDKVWTAYTPQYLEDSRKSNSPVFLNATAAWCISCQVNERLVFQDERVKGYFREKNFRLIKADWTKKDATIRALLSQHNRAGVPLYLYYPPGQQRPVILPELLTVDLLLGSLKVP
jgi:DsbC/DsbD-like thiol-disulfide interchange protein/cytochrome c biogenesis protein CcdA